VIQPKGPVGQVGNIHKNDASKVEGNHTREGAVQQEIPGAIVVTEWVISRMIPHLWILPFRAVWMPRKAQTHGEQMCYC